MHGLVIRTTGSWYKVLSHGDADLFDCRLRGSYRLRGNKQTNPVAVGDNVEFRLQDDGTGIIDEVCDRRNYIVRRATKLSKQTHVIAANIDRLCIIATLAFPRTSTGFIDRLLVTAEAYRIPACIILNKCDLYDDDLRAEYLRWQEIYSSAGYELHAVSALGGQGIAELRSRIVGQTVLFSGHSGVGKSALLNALVPELRLREGDISDWNLKGRHTTTFAEMYPLVTAPDGTFFPLSASPFTAHRSPLTYLIDTPGIKEFGMVDIRPEELAHYYPEMHRLSAECRYPDCTHRHEPHCAVKTAVQTGLISPERYANYLGIYDQILNDAAAKN